MDPLSLFKKKHWKHWIKSFEWKDNNFGKNLPGGPISPFSPFSPAGPGYPGIPGGPSTPFPGIPSKPRGPKLPGAPVIHLKRFTICLFLKEYN